MITTDTYLCVMRKTFTDQLNREVIINYPPRRIISLVPSQTELLFELGLSEEIIGITKFCIHPAAQCKVKQKIGGTKKLDIDLIRSLKPDLIIGNKEENTRENIELLSAEFPVWLSDVSTLEEAMEMISQIAELVDRQPEAAYLNHLIKAGFTDLQTLALQHGIDKKVAYLMWKEPYMLAGRETFINDILMKIGLSNISTESRYPVTGLEELALMKPDLVLLSSEPFPFREKHMDELQQALPGVEIMLVDGEMFSWYGSRLIKAVQYHFQLQPKLK
ncbi:helical backbone metal receptor [Pedobacter sp. MC2016-15]|jgi:ABC-type Fe3+-hydroxamate transport system substrate-binding protein|uniref:ABC transporter substrate-binding protein n=1 Tax=Pedobacter sp. MC2016-15 TaxID=2994473 RepID=UPI002247BEC4|nr:helical backbone metal receptor [Pedobacter sp. MC2016-15]MCX2479550.1 helical backbone metal receptor [Pedobacter sp. MC2016-15]